MVYHQRSVYQLIFGDLELWVRTFKSEHKCVLAKIIYPGYAKDVALTFVVFVTLTN